MTPTPNATLPPDSTLRHFHVLAKPTGAICNLDCKYGFFLSKATDDGCDVGHDTGAPVSPDYGPRGNAFTGTIRGVQIAIGEAAERADHLVPPEEAVRVALARQ